jgi:hypothetical protein
MYGNLYRMRFFSDTKYISVGHIRYTKYDVRCVSKGQKVKETFNEKYIYICENICTVVMINTVDVIYIETLGDRTLYC